MVTTTMSKIDPGLEYGLVSCNCPSQTKHGEEMNVRCTNSTIPQFYRSGAHNTTSPRSTLTRGTTAGTGGKAIGHVVTTSVFRQARRVLQVGYAFATGIAVHDGI